MSHTVAVGEFEGPLGVLLELVERQKLEVTEISVGQITADYLEQIQQLPQSSTEDLSEFIQLGARLLYIKSLALLPHDNSPEQSGELQQLQIELQQYRRFQQAAKNLAARSQLATFTRPAAPPLAARDLPIPQIQPDQLAAAFTRALKLAPTLPATTILRRHLNLETVLTKLRNLLPGGFGLQSIFEQCHDRLEIVVTFLAILELIRNGEAKATQISQFEPIMVEPAHV